MVIDIECQFDQSCGNRCTTRHSRRFWRCRPWYARFDILYTGPFTCSTRGGGPIGPRASTNPAYVVGWFDQISITTSRLQHVKFRSLNIHWGLRLESIFEHIGAFAICSKSRVPFMVMISFKTTLTAPGLQPAPSRWSRLTRNMFWFTTAWANWLDDFTRNTNSDV